MADTSTGEVVPWATFDDLKSRYSTISDDEKRQAEALLLDASAKIDAALDNAGIDYATPTAKYMALLKAVCCSMVMRASPSFSGGIGAQAPISQSTQTAGAFSQTFLYANPSGDLYLTKQEKADLGITGYGGIGCVFPYASAWGVDA